MNKALCACPEGSLAPDRGLEGVHTPDLEIDSFLRFRSFGPSPSEDLVFGTQSINLIIWKPKQEKNHVPDDLL